MNMYHVTYDYLIGGKYHEQNKRFCAENAKEACEQIKRNYNERIDALTDKGYSLSAAKRIVRWPFHIKAKRMP